jgi:shikimate dehydrogenase
VRRLAVIGYPIKHSISPAMQQAALDARGIDAAYERRQVLPDELAGFVPALRGGEWLGINVTIPHKEAIMPLLDALSPEAAAIGAVNTVVVKGERLTGHNTDATGFLESLAREGGYDPRGQHVAVLGAGGAARAVVWALLTAGAGSVRLFNRSAERAEALALAARSWGGSDEVVAEPWAPEALARSLPECSLVVNSTSVGMGREETPLLAGLIPAGALVADLIYNPRPTRLLREAAARGARTLDGLPMLVYQGAAAFRLWTGQDAPIEVMLSAAEGSLPKA